MVDTTRDSDAILKAAGDSLRVNRDEGGFHRGRGSIGRGSKQVKRNNLLKRAAYFGAAVLAIFVAASVAGMILQGIGFVGVMVAFFAIVAAGFIFANYPKVRIPDRADLSRTQDPRRLVARTELWLENQRHALPPPAVQLVDELGVQLDALGKQLEHVDPTHSAAVETRKLVGEYLPETIDSYRRIPDHLRKEERAGETPDAQLVNSLQKISKEIDHVTRQLAEGSLDDLAIKNRYLDYKYGGEDTSLPPSEKES